MSEDFEDGILDSKISIETVGTFNSNPDIKDITNFGSTKAFGFGRSTCGSSCFDNYVTNFKITLPSSTYISTISFNEMELFDNWGSKGKIYIDGEPISWGSYNENEDFGRQPTNDRQADTTYRSQSYSINQYVTIIEIKVHDITSSSEIFIDDVEIFGKETLGWKDDFESYTPGQFPSPNWSYTGNSDITVDDSKSAQGNQSLRIYGPVGGCWEAIACRPMDVSTSEGFTIEFYVYISSDHQEGCHSWEGAASMQDVCNWMIQKGASIIEFYYDGGMYSRIGYLGTYGEDTWYKVKMKYERINDSTVKLSYWIDDVFKGTQSVPAASYEDDLSYFSFSSGDGAVWIDNILVSEQPKFIDVPPGHWAEEAIYKIYEAGITQGCSQNPLKFCPDVVTNREQMAVFLGRGVHGSEFTPPDATGIFADVSLDHWAADWIEQAYDDGITQGCATNPLRYCPTVNVTRAQMAVFLLRAKHGGSYMPPAASGIFSDVDLSHWAAPWIEQLYNEGITVGCGTNPLRYCPDTSVTRAQMAVFLMRTFGL